MKLEGIFATPEVENRVTRLVASMLSERREKGTVTYEPIPPPVIKPHDCTKGECAYVSAEHDAEAGAAQREEAGETLSIVPHAELPTIEAFARLSIKKQPANMGTGWSGGDEPVCRVSQMRGEPQPDRGMMRVWPVVKS